MGFADSVRASRRKIMGQVDKKIETIAVELFIKSVDYSPTQPQAQASKGEFVNNWSAGIGSTLVKVKNKTLDSSGGMSRASARSLVGKKSFFGKDGEVTFTNTTSYGLNVELYGWPSPEWSGTIGPYSPVRRAMTLVSTKYKGP